MGTTHVKHREVGEFADLNPAYVSVEAKRARTRDGGELEQVRGRETGGSIAELTEQSL